VRIAHLNEYRTLEKVRDAHLTRFTSVAWVKLPGVAGKGVPGGRV